MKNTFRAKPYKVAMIHWVDLPKKAIDALKLPRAEIKGGGLGLNAILRFNDDLDRVTLLPGRPGHYKLAIKAELMRGAKVKGGDTIAFTLTPDAASRDPELPEAMRRAFQARPDLAEVWRNQSIANRVQVVRYIEQAKSPEVREKRSWIFLERMAENGTLSP
jgi:predicted Rdx family selenoprotein